MKDIHGKNGVPFARNDQNKKKAVVESFK